VEGRFSRGTDPESGLQSFVYRVGVEDVLEKGMAGFHDELIQRGRWGVVFFFKFQCLSEGLRGYSESLIHKRGCQIL